MMINLLKRVFHNQYMFAVLTRCIGIVLGFLYTIVLSRYLGPSLRGEYSIVQNYANIAASVIGFGIYQAYPFYKKKANEPEKRNLFINFSKNIIGLYLIYQLLFTACALIFPLELRFRITLVILPLAFLYKQINYLVLIEDSRRSNIADIILGVFDIIFVLFLMLVTKANLFWCIFFLIIDKSVYAFLAVFNLQINFFKNKPIINSSIIEYAKYGFIPMITVLLMTFNYKIDVVMLSLFDNIETAEIGIYSLGVMLAEKIWMIPDVLTNILQSRLVGGKKEDEVAKISRISLCITALCLIVIVIFGRPLILLAYGRQYESAYPITVIIFGGVLGMVFYKVVYAYNIVTGKRKVNFILLCISALINILLNFVLIRIYGTIGAGIASLISFIACGGMFLADFLRSTGVPIRNMVFIKGEDIYIVKEFLTDMKRQK